MGSWYLYLSAVILSEEQRSQILEQKEGQDEEVYDLKLNDCFVVFKLQWSVCSVGIIHGYS
jgi:hypothetical protein